jgi:hypothetical protein
VAALLKVYQADMELFDYSAEPYMTVCQKWKHFCLHLVLLLFCHVLFLKTISFLFMYVESEWEILQRYRVFDCCGSDMNLTHMGCCSLE